VHAWHDALAERERVTLARSGVLASGFASRHQRIVDREVRVRVAIAPALIVADRSIRADRHVITAIDHAVIVDAPGNPVSVAALLAVLAS
jgi:hypothetical protein